MKSPCKVRNLRLRLEQLEDRLQPSLGLFGDPLAADPLTGRVEENTSELQLVANAAVTQDTTTATPGAPAAPQQPVAQVATVAGGEAHSTAALQVILNATGGQQAAQPGKGLGLVVAESDVAEEQYAVVGRPGSTLAPIDPGSFTITTTQCGTEGPGTQDFTWSQYRGGAGVEVNFRTDATDAGVVYSAGVGTDEVAGDNPGTVTMRNGATCTTASLGTPEGNFLILYGVNVDGAGGSVYTAGFDVFSGVAYVFKLSADLTTIEAGIQSASQVALNFFFDIVNDTQGNRYVVGMAQNPGQQNANSVRLTKFDANLTLPATYDVVITFLDAPGGNPRQSLGLSMDVDAAGNAYAGGGIVYAADDIRNVTLRFDGTAMNWAFTGNQVAGASHGPNGGMYGVSVQGDFVYTTGIRDDATAPGNDRRLVYKRPALAGTPGTLINWRLTNGGDLHGYGIDVGTDELPLIVGTAAGPEGDTDGTITKYGAGLNTVVGSDFIGNPTLDPNKDDDLYGVALIGAGATPDFALSGDTNSDDLVPIMNACTGEDTFGGLLDGYMARYAQPLP